MMRKTLGCALFLVLAACDRTPDLGLGPDPAGPPPALLPLAEILAPRPARPDPGPALDAARSGMMRRADRLAEND